MDTKDRIKELSSQRKQKTGFIARFGHLEGKSVARNTRARHAIIIWGKKQDDLQINDCDIIQRKVFNFDRIRHDIADTTERIHCLDTIDTLDLDRYVVAMKALIAVKSEIREAFGKELHRGCGELNTVTGYNFL